MVKEQCVFDGVNNLGDFRFGSRVFRVDDDRRLVDWRFEVSHVIIEDGIDDVMTLLIRAIRSHLFLAEEQGRSGPKR